MTPKQRILAALNHEQTDRIPIDLTQDEMSAQLEAGLREYFLVKDVEAIRLALGLDIRWVQPVCRRLSKHPELAGTTWYGTAAGSNASFAESVGSRPLKGVERLADVNEHKWPDPDWFDYQTVATLCEQYKDYAIVAPFTWSPLFCRVCELCGMEETLMMLYDRPAMLEAIVERITDFSVEFLTRTLDAAPNQIDIMYTGDDPAGQNGMLISIDTWRRFFKKPYKRICEVAKARNVRVMFHCCGAVMDLVPELLNIGVDILQPLQFRAAGMDPRKLKAEFGKDLCFCGGVDIQQTLPHGTPEQVRAEVRELIDVLSEDGGYILAPSHALLSDVPMANVIAMYDEARAHCRQAGTSNLVHGSRE